MNGSTRACTTILNVFGLFSLLVGLLATVFAVLNSAGFSLAMLIEALPGLASVLSGTLLIGSSEGLRLLSEIRDSLASRNPAVRTRRAA